VTVVPARAETPLDLAEIWGRSLTVREFLERAKEPYRSLWEGIYRNAKAPEWAASALPEGTVLRLIMIAEDWCMDTNNTAPFLARFTEAVPGVSLRFLLRDENPEVMDRYLYNGSRSIPVVIILDEACRELGHWGPRPAELQAWVRENKDVVTTEERVLHTRKWYARDRGETTIREVLKAAGF
jgi:Thioredoxin